MNYNRETREKALKKLMETDPHNIEALRKLYAMESDDKNSVRPSIQEILLSTTWGKEEKIELIKLYGYEKNINSKVGSDEHGIGSEYNVTDIIPTDLCITNHNLTGLEALAELGAKISAATVAYAASIDNDPKLRYIICQLLLKYYGGKKDLAVVIATENNRMTTSIPSLCDRYAEYGRDFGMKIVFRREISSMKAIVETNDLELVKLFLPTIINIKPLLRFATATGNIEIASLFTQAGADVNYQEKDEPYNERSEAYRINLKVAIDNNNLLMIMFLHRHGANLNFVDNSEVIKKLASKYSLDDARPNDRYFQNYLTWMASPLEYAIKLGPVSILGEDLINASYIVKRTEDPDKKQVADRLAIVKYLHQHGATYTDGTINYNELLSFYILAKDLEATQSCFEEAINNGYPIDFTQLIPMVLKPAFKLPDNYAAPFIPEIGIPMFETIYEYAKKSNEKNSLLVVQQILETIFSNIEQNEYRFDAYQEMIDRLTKLLPDELVKQIPAVLHVHIKDIEYIKKLGYNVNFIDKEGNNRLINTIWQNVKVKNIAEIISCGVEPSYLNKKKNGESALSKAISALPDCDSNQFSLYLDHRNSSANIRNLFETPDLKATIELLIRLSNTKIMNSRALRMAVEKKLSPGYQQYIYIDFLKELLNKGFKASDKYVTESLASVQSIENPLVVIDYLKTLLDIFPNDIRGSFLSLPFYGENNDKFNIKETKQNLYDVLKQVFERTYITKTEQLEKASNIEEEKKYDRINEEHIIYTPLMVAQSKLLNEIAKFVNRLSASQTLKLIDACPILDLNMLTEDGNNLLTLAMQSGNKELCLGLMKRGATIVYHNKKGQDVTSNIIKREYIYFFLRLGGQYNDDSEVDELLALVTGGKQRSMPNPNKLKEDSIV